MQICQPKRLLSHPKDKDLPIWRHAAFVNVKAWHKGNNLNKTENVLWISLIFIQYKGAGGASETDEYSEGSKRPLPPYTPPFSENHIAIFSKFHAQKAMFKGPPPTRPKGKTSMNKKLFLSGIARLAFVVRRREGPSPKNLDSDEIFKP